MLRSLVALTLLLPGMAVAGTLDEARASGVLRIGTPGDYAPYAVHAPDGSYAGAEIELARNFAQSLGLRAEILPTSWKAMATDFAGGKFDLVVGGVSVTPDRAQAGDFSVPLSEDGKRPVVRCVDKDRYTTLDAIDQPAVRVIVNLGGTNEAFAHARFFNAPIAVEMDNVSVPQRLLDDRADVFVTDGAEVDLLAKRFPGRLCAATVPQPFTRMIKAWWLSRDPALKQAADAYLTAAKSNGSWQALLDRNMK